MTLRASERRRTHGNRGISKSGTKAEDRAALHLQRNGLTIVERNFHCRLGEIDLIALDDDCLVFVEVRQRAKGGLVSAAASVTASKQRRLIATAQFFLMQHPDVAERPMRFDVVMLEGEQLDWQHNVIQIDG